MASRDLAAIIDDSVALNSTAVSSATTTVGNIIDMKDYESLAFISAIAGTVAGTFTPLIEHGDASDLSDAVAVEDGYLSGTEAGAALTVTNTSSKIGYLGKKRYVRLSIVSTGGSPTGTILGLAVRGDKNKEPIA